MLTTVVLIVVMLLLSAFFSGMEIAFTSKNRLKLEIDRKQNRMFDQIAEVFARHPGQYITTILVGNNIALVVYSLAMSLLLRSIYASLGWEQLARSGSVAVDTAVSTVIIIFFAEFLPKSIFRNNPNFYYRALAPVIYFFYIVLYPVARFTTLLSHGILHLLGRRVEERNITPSFDREDLAALLDTNSPEQHSEPDNELKLFQNALGFRRPARQGLHGSACGRRGRGHRRHLDRTAHGAFRRLEIFAYLRLAQVDRPTSWATSIRKAFSRGPGRSPT